MSRSNYDKPFYVDVGTSIAAIRCASNHDVVVRFDHVLHPYALELAKDACDRMNKEVKKGKPLRNCDAGTSEEQLERLFSGMDDKGVEIGLKFIRGIAREILTWSQMPYEEGGVK